MHLLTWENGEYSILIDLVRRFETITEANEILHQLELNSTHTTKHVILECNQLHWARSIIVNHVRDIFISARNYHFLLPNHLLSSMSLVEFFSEEYKELNVLNITMFQLSSKYFGSFADGTLFPGNLVEYRKMYDNIQKMDKENDFVNFIHFYKQTIARADFNQQSEHENKLNTEQQMQNNQHFVNNNNDNEENDNDNSKREKFSMINGVEFFADGILLFDGVQTLFKSLNTMYHTMNYLNNNRSSSFLFFSLSSNTTTTGSVCNLAMVEHFNSTQFSNRIRNVIAKQYFDGLTGPVDFDQLGRRKTYAIDIIEFGFNVKPQLVNKFG